MLIAYIALLVDKVSCGPIALLVRSPRCAVVIKGDCVLYFKLLRGLQYVFVLFFVAKLRIVNADDGEIVPFVFFMPFPDPGNYALAVNSTEGPKFEQNYFASHICQTDRSV